MRYGFLDLDEDGVPELILLPAGDGAEYWSIFTLREGVPSGSGAGGIRNLASEFRINEDKTLYAHFFSLSGEIYSLKQWPGETLKKTEDPAETVGWPDPMPLDFKTFESYRPQKASLPEGFEENSVPYTDLLTCLSEQLKTDWSGYDGRYPLDAVRRFCEENHTKVVSIGFEDLNGDHQPELFLSGNGDILSVFTATDGSPQLMLEKQQQLWGENVVSTTILLYSDRKIEVETWESSDIAYVLLQAQPGSAQLTEIARTTDVYERHAYKDGAEQYQVISMPLREFERSLTDND